MEWRQQTSFSCADAFNEAQRWIEEVTGKSFGCKDFRPALENGVLLCDLINQLKPGIIKRVNRLSTPIAGLDNVNVFLKACGKLGLNVSQLFHPGDLQDLSTRANLRGGESIRRVKNVLITIYWLGRKAHLDVFYSGPQLNFKAFEGLLGLALSKSLDEVGNVLVKDSGDRECCYPERDDCRRMIRCSKMENSADRIDSLHSRALRQNSDGCGSDAEAEQMFKMETTQPPAGQNKGCIPSPLRRKQGKQAGTGRGSSSPIARSKSLSDIPMVYPVRKVPDVNTFYDVGQDAGMEQKWSHEYKRPCSVGAKDNEAQWHDDLTKWKNRRRSSKSDQRRKSLDREHVVKQMINGASNNFEKKGAHGGLQKRDLQSPHRHNSAPRPYSTSFSSKSSSSDLRPRTRALLARSYAIEAPFSPAAHIQGSSAGLMPASDGNILGEAAHFASLASDGAGVTTPSVDCPYSSQTQVKAQGILAPFHPTSDLAQPENIITNHISTLVTTIQPKESAKSTRTRDPTTLISSHKEPPLERGRSLQATGVYKYLSRAGTWSGSSSLPRGYRRLEGSSRLSSAITARPFGTKHSRMSSLPRLSHKDDIQGLPLKSEKEESLSPPFGSSLKRQTASAHLKAPCLDSVQQKRADQAKQNGTEHGKGVRGVTLSSRTSSQTNIYQHQPYSQTQLLLQPYSSLQTHHKKSPTLPSNGGIDRIKVDHSDMRVSLALKPNSRPDFGFQTHWDSTGARIKYIQPGSPAELCQLCVDDEIVAVNGVAVTHMNYSQWKDKMTSYLQTGNLAMDIRRYGNKGGSESAISDLQVPSLSPSSSSWSWDPEEHRRRQEKWQEEQERLLQEQYQRDQERLESEWRRAQQEVVGELCRKSGNTFEMTNGGQSSLSTHGLTNKTREVEQSPELKGGVSDPPSNAKGVQNVKITEQAWAEDSCGFAQLSAQHRGKSLSTPSLPSLHKQTKVDQRRTIGHSVSNVEKERQLILEEMKKKTQLLTDNSWIRQRRSSFYKEPIYVGAPIKRYESLDNLDTLRQSPLSTVTFTYPRPHSVASGYCAPSRNAASRYSTSATLSQRNASVDSFNHGRMVSGRRTCCVCERVLGSGAAMVIEALSVCFHLACFQCVGCHRHLRGTGSGAQVRISNRKPYCEPCYFELKSADAPSL